MSYPPCAFTAGLGVVFLGSEVEKQGTVVGDKRSVQGIMGRGPSVPHLGMDHDSGLCIDPSGAFLS